MKHQPDAIDLTYPLGAAARLTGLSPEVLRAWERRYGAVRPLRTAGGTRRYSRADLERLRLLKLAVAAGDRIGQLAQLDLDELKERVAQSEATLEVSRLDPILAALDRLDGAEAQRLLSLQLSALGPDRFARELALPLVREIGERWASGRLGIASEHLASGILRSLLGSALQPTSIALRGPRIVFSTLSGERHELGLLMAALTAMGAGANPIFLGADVPVEALLEAMERTRAKVLALGVVTLPETEVAQSLRALRDGLPDEVRLWLGGPGANAEILPSGVERLGGLEELAQRIALLGFEGPRLR